MQQQMMTTRRRHFEGPTRHVLSPDLSQIGGSWLPGHWLSGSCRLSLIQPSTKQFDRLGEGAHPVGPGSGDRGSLTGRRRRNETWDVSTGAEDSGAQSVGANSDLTIESKLAHHDGSPEIRDLAARRENSKGDG
jgi:hypothetical protein